MTPLFIQNITYEDAASPLTAETTRVTEFPGGIISGFGIPVDVPPQRTYDPFGIIKYPPVLFFKTMKLPTTAPELGSMSEPGVMEVMLLYDP